MKTRFFLLTTSILLLFNHVGYAQCFPNAAYGANPFGLYPAGAMQMDCSGLSASKTVISLTDTLTIVLINPADPDTINFFLGGIRIMEVDGLPTGLILTTDVINTATQESPFGAWLHPGGVHNLTPSVGCISVVGNQSDWDAASTGGPNNDGVYPLIVSYDMRLDSAYPYMRP